MQLLARGEDLQKSSRKGFTKPKTLLPKTNKLKVLIIIHLPVQSHVCAQVRMVAIRLTRVQTYKRYGPMKEVEVLPNSSYSEVCFAGTAALETHNDITSSDGQFALFHPDGTIIPDEPGWTIRGYMSDLNKGFSQMKLGVGIVYEVMPFLL